jgi:hypothetical protein
MFNSTPFIFRVLNKRGVKGLLDVYESIGPSVTCADQWRMGDGQVREQPVLQRRQAAGRKGG